MKKSTAALIESLLLRQESYWVFDFACKARFGNNNGNKSYHYYGDNWTHNLDDDTSCDFDSDCESKMTRNVRIWKKWPGMLQRKSSRRLMRSSKKSSEMFKLVNRGY